MGKGPEFCVPLDSLSMPDDKDQMTPPEVGDVVNAQVEGKVSRIEGENAYVVATSINGKPIGEEEAAEPSPEDQDQAQLAELQDMAQKQGAMS